MKIIENIDISKNQNGELWSNITGRWLKFDDIAINNRLNTIYNLARKKHADISTITKLITECKQLINGSTEEDIADKEAEHNKKITICQTTINFFKEFDFTPNFRFMNTLLHADNKAKYITNYFKLTDNSYTDSVISKLTSYEATELLTDLSSLTSTDSINKRFKLYYGAQGTGKTTEAMKEADNNVMVCHSAMLPSDLMEDFKFNDGKAAFTPSILCKAMTEGHKIVLDEINLLPFESLRFLQSLLDNKSQIIYKGQVIEIKDGFEIIGTMNLKVNGMTYALPEPLVDRAFELKEFVLSAEQLASALV